jgi:hypothetical protein
MMPLVFGLIPALDHYVTGFAALFGSIFGLSVLVLYAILNQLMNIDGGVWNSSTIINGLQSTFYQVYDWPAFTIALCFSVAGVFLYAAVAEAYYRLSGKKRPTPSHLVFSPYFDEKPAPVRPQHISTGTMENTPVIAELD